MTELLLELTALLTFWLCLAAWQRDRTARGRRLFMGLCGAVILWNAGNLVQALGAMPDREALRLSYLGMLTLPALWLALALVVRGARFAERAPWALALLLAPGLGCYALLFHESGLPRDWLTTNMPIGGVYFGPPSWLIAGWCWILAGLGCFHLGRSARSLRGQGDKLRRVALAFASVVPLAANALYATTGMPGFDATPMLLGAWLVMLRSELFSGDLLQALPVTQHDLLSQLPTPLILTDLTGRVTEINSAAQNYLCIAKADALDRNIEALLEGADLAPEFDRFALVATGKEAGSILLPATPKQRGGSQ